MCLMNRKDASTMPISIATVRSMNTVSNTVARYTARSARGRVLQQVFGVVELAQLAGDHDQDRGQHRHRHLAGQRRGQQDDQQHEHRVRETGHAGFCAGQHVGAGAGDDAGGRHAAEQRRQDVGRALRQQFAVGLVAVAGHVVGHHGGQQRFHADQNGDGEGRAHQFQQMRQADLRAGWGRAAWTAPGRTGWRWFRPET